jgi:hypothetical protein
MITKYRKLVDSDTLHEQYASNKLGQIGIIQLWAFNNCYLFLNYETLKKSQISLKGVSKLKILGELEFNLLFNTAVLKGSISIPKAEEFYLDYSTNKVWADQFCREMAGFITNYTFFSLVVRKYGTMAEARKDPNFKKIISDYFDADNPNAMFYKKLLEMGSNNDCTAEIKISEKQIVDYIKKAKLLPEQFVKSIFDKKMLKTKEIKHYLKEAE